MCGRVRESERVSVVPAPPRGLTRRRALAGVAAGCLVLVLLGVGVLTGFGPQLRLDTAASRFFYVGDHPPVWLHDLLGVETAPGLTVVRLILFAPLVLWLLLRRARWPAAWVTVALVTVGPLTSLLKDGFDRVRPQFAGGGARLHTLSFPSGHSSGIATLVVVALVLAWPLLTRALRRLALALGVLAIVAVGLGRMWQGVHYLTDVLGGWAFGTAWALALALAFDAFPGGRAALTRRGAVEA
jgi:membrane-associated phospholipid phosphatase